jgi:dCMP deaminase
MFPDESFRRKRPNEAQSLENFIETNDSVNTRNPKVVDGTTQVSLINDFTTKEALFSKLEALDLLNPERLRPSWDSYFMVRDSVHCTCET